MEDIRNTVRSVNPMLTQVILFINKRRDLLMSQTVVSVYTSVHQLCFSIFKTLFVQWSGVPLFLSTPVIPRSSQSLLQNFPLIVTSPSLLSSILVPRYFPVSYPYIFLHNPVVWPWPHNPVPKFPGTPVQVFLKSSLNKTYCHSGNLSLHCISLH